MRPILAAALAAAAVAAASPAAAQLSLEVRGGAGAGSYGATGAGFQPVPGTAGSAHLGYAFHPRLAAYAGYSNTGFGCVEGFCEGVDPTFTSSGLDAGVRFQLPAGLWVRGGAVVHALKVDSPVQDESSDAAFGVGAGAGFTIPLGSRLALTPGVGYTRYTASMPDGSDPVAVFTADLGLRFDLSGARR